MKLQDCPYQTSDSKCTHSYPTSQRDKKKPLCSYNNVKKCKMYILWLKQRKAIPAPINPPLNNKGERTND